MLQFEMAEYRKIRADGGRFAPAGLASRAPPIAHCALPQVPPPVHYEGGGDKTVL